MFEGKMDWSEPFQMEDSDGVMKWQRIWMIPVDARSAFFAFWSSNKFRLWNEGFSVKKIENEWYLLECKIDPQNFKEFPGVPKPKCAEIEEEAFWSPPYKVKNTDGLREWQVDSVSKVVSAINKIGCAIDGSDVGCHKKGQLILMSNGLTKKVEDIVIGDSIMGWKGPQIVTELHRGKEEMVKIIPVKGNPFEVNKNHILTVVFTNGPKTHKTTGGFNYGDVVDIKISDYMKLSPTTKNYMKLFSVGVDSWKKIKQQFTPYFIGALLGDGGLSQDHTVSFTNNDNEVWAEIKKECEKYEWILGYTNEPITKRITNSPNLFSWLRNKKMLPIKCENKFIPQEYKICSKKQRLEILAGILDTDGWCRNGGFDITLKSKQLSNDICFIARSLGFSSYVKPVKKKCYNNGKIGDYYKTSISGDCSIIPCRIKRKIAKRRIQKKNACRTGFRIETLGVDDFYGFSLSGDGRYLIDNFVVTHNTGKTYVSCAVARELGMDLLVVCPKAVREAWKRVVCKHFKMRDQLVEVINYEQLRIGKKDSFIASYVKNRRTHREKFVWKIPKNTLIIWDESQKLKNWKTQNSKTCIEAFKAGYKMLFCSATNATNPLELRTVGTCLQLFKGNKQYYLWCYEHGVGKGRFGLEFTTDIKVRQKVLKKLHHDIFINRGVRLSRDTIPNFPESEIIAECYNMDEEDVKKINSYHKEMASELQRLQKQIIRDKSSELTAILRARQKTELTKVPLIVDMVEEGIEEGMSVVVFVNFTDTINALAKRLNTRSIFDGKTTDKVRQKNIDDFQDDKERVILINAASGGAGLSLGDMTGKYPRLALISPSYSAIVMRQVTGRVWRESSKTKSIQKIVFVAGTVEEDVCEAVKLKLDNMDMLNDGDLLGKVNYI
jgi:hypothetical protein